MEKIMLGTVYLNGEPREPGVLYSGEQIRLGQSVPGMEIQWVRLSSGLLIADRCVCTQISWEQLHSQGLVFGTVIQIDGKGYLCRCLKVGIKGGDANEWDAALAEVGEDNEVWHWAGQYFWGQETPEGWASSRAVRGYHSARNWNYYDATYRDVHVGFRPALDPLAPAPLDYGPLVGTEITFIGLDSETISGKLAYFTDYDLVLEAASSLPDVCKWAIPDGERVIIDRASVAWLREV